MVAQASGLMVEISMWLRMVAQALTYCGKMASSFTPPVAFLKLSEPTPAAFTALVPKPMLARFGKTARCFTRPPTARNCTAFTLPSRSAPTAKSAACPSPKASRMAARAGLAGPKAMWTTTMTAMPVIGTVPESILSTVHSLPQRAIIALIIGMAKRPL